MSKFNLSKHGYETSEVDQYIDSLVMKYEDRLAEQRKHVIELKNELTSTQKRLSDYSGKDKQISQTLMAAVEKAEEIQENARGIYELELKRINILYSAWKDVVEELEDIGIVENNEYLREMLSIFHSNLDKALSVKMEKEEETKKDYIRSILEKMRGLIKEREEEPIPTFTDEDDYYDEVIVENKKEKGRLSNISAHLNNFVKKSLDGKSRSGELYEQGSAYERSFIRKREEEKPSESGFDLNEALHPKEDLEEIMKAFDFANSKRDKKD